MWAVGSYQAADTHGVPIGRLRALALHWTGSGWHNVPVPHLGKESEFLGVAARTANEIWAVGDFTNSALTTMGLVQRWTGTSWQQVALPASAAPSTVHAVTVAKGGDVFATGYATTGPGAATRHAGAWSVYRSQPLSGRNPTAFLSAVTAVSASDVWVVGSQHPHSDPTLTLTEHWTGTGLRRSASPNPVTPVNELYGVTRLRDGTLLAVGGGHGSNNPRYCRPSPSATPPADSGPNSVGLAGVYLKLYRAMQRAPMAPPGSRRPRRLPALPGSWGL